MSDLKKKTATGFIYSFAERMGAQGIGFIVQVLLGRLLMPEEYGLVALVTVFVTVFDVFVTYGFGNSLIADKDSDSTDFSTCFYFGLFLGIITYLLIFFISPFLGSYYANVRLIPVLRVMGLRLPIAAINSVQHAYVSKHMQFKKFFYATLIGTVVSGMIAVVMAYFGFGVWSLVEQYLGNVVIDTICLTIIVGWRPTLEFSFIRLKTIYAYGWKILAVGLIDTIYGQLRNLIIGKKYSSEDLAYYNRGYKFPSFGMRLIEPTVNNVLFPALSKCQDDQTQMREITRKVMMASTYIISPIMIGLVVIARPLVIVLLTEKWLPCVIYLQIGCVANLFRPNQFINNCIIKSSGNSDLLLRLDVIKKIIGLSILLVSTHYGVIGVALSVIVVYFLSMIINIAPNRNILNYGYKAQCVDFLRNLIPALIMGMCVYPFSLLGFNSVVTLTIQIFGSIIVYWILSIILKNESYQTTKYFVAKYIMKNEI